MTRQETDELVLSMMVELFGLERAAIKPETRLFEELDLDSIDAIDMAVKLQQISGRRVNDSALREVRTVQDVMAFVEKHLGAA